MKEKITSIRPDIQEVRNVFQSREERNTELCAVAMGITIALLILIIFLK